MATTKSKKPPTQKTPEPIPLPSHEFVDQEEGGYISSEGDIEISVPSISPNMGRIQSREDKLKVEAKLKKVEALQAKVSLHRGLPHLYGWRNYKWAREFLESTNKNCFLNAANQISKSSTQIRKVIDWATDKSKWQMLWGAREPRQFWYLYPTKEVASIEFELKWVPDFLPRLEYKNHPIYGWKEEKKGRNEIHAIHFNSGVSIIFKTYAQDVQHLQSSSCDYIAFDEELPEELWDELNFRRVATSGYVSGVFTATIGQEFWRRVMEPKTPTEEILKGAWKKQVSMFDCRYYEDGTPSHWTAEKIAQAIAACKSDAEVQRRIMGKFVVDSGLKYPSFSMAKNLVPPFEIPADWDIYGGVDIGAGGDNNHPPAISLIAVRPDRKFGVVFRSWLGKDRVYTAGDVVDQYIHMTRGLRMVGQWYDYHSKDFATIATRKGLAFSPAEKRHDIGEHVINTLFKNGMLAVLDHPEMLDLCTQFSTLKIETDKRKAVDDAIDSTRYGVVKIDWDWSAVGESEHFKDVLGRIDYTAKEQLIKSRREFALGKPPELVDNISTEIAAYNELYEDF